jgi:hypothetical protein
VQVLPPPRFVPRDGRPSPQVTIDPPAYSKLPSADLPDGTGIVESVIGTRVRLRAKTDRRIVAASIRPHGDRPEIMLGAAIAVLGMPPLLAVSAEPFARQIVEPIPLAISGDDGTLLDLDAVVRWNGLHALTMTDESGLTGTRLFDLRMYPDPSPNVTLDRPAAGLDALTLLPTASVTIESRAEDRTFGLKTVALEYRYATEAAQSIGVANYAALGRAQSGLVGGPLAEPMPTSAFASLSGTMPLSRFAHADGLPPKPGDVLTLRATADDWDDVAVLKPAGRSREVVIRVVNRPTLDAELQKGLVDLRPTLKQTLEQERAAQQLADEVRKKLEAGQPLSPSDRERLDQAMQNLLQAKGKLTSPGDGAKDRLNDLQRTAKANDLPPQGTAATIDAAARTANRLADENLDPAEAALAAARRESDPAKAAAALEEFRKNQQATVNGISSIVERLDRWGSAAELQSDARQLQNRLNAVGDELTKPTPTGKPGDDLAKLAADANALLDRANRMAGEKQTGDAGAKAEAEAIRGAVDKAGGSQLTDDLKAAAAAAKAGRGGDAERQRAAAAERLGQMAEALAPKSDEPKPDELRKNRKQDAADLKSLAEQADELRKKAKNAEATTDPVERRQQLEKLAREQEQLQKQAAEQMAAAAEKQRQGQTGQAEQENAEQQLQKAQQEFPKETKEADEQLEREERERWLEEIRSFRERQKNAVAEANRLLAEALREKAWDRPLLASLTDLADQQQRLSEAVAGFATKNLEPYPVFAKLVNRSAEAMAKASKRLTERKDDALATDPGAAFDAETERLAHARPLKPMLDALKALDVLADSLKPDDKPKANGDPPMGGGDPPPMPMGETGGPPRQQGIPPLAQLKVLRALQADLNERTADFAKRNPDPEKYDEDAKDERAALEADQKEIAELFGKLQTLLKPTEDEP